MDEQLERRLLAAFDKQQRGHSVEAEAEFRAILASDPDNAHAHNLLGVICLNSGRPAEAETHITKALRIDPDDAEAHANQSMAWLALGKLDLAERAIRVSLRLDPGRAASLAHLGCIYLENGLASEAVAHLSEALRRGPPRPEWLVSLSAAYCDLGQVELAIGGAKRALDISSGHAAALAALGNALIKGCEYSEAVAAFDRAISVNPDFADAWIGKGTALKEAGEASAAESVLCEACQRFPDEPRCHFMLGTLHEQSGCAGEAAAAFRSAIAASPGYGAAYFQLLQLAGASLDSAELEQLRALVDNPSAAGASAHAHFALARVCEKNGAFAEAMEHYHQGHRLLGRQHRYDDSEVSRFYGEIAASLQGSAAPPVANQDDPVTPIFVVGMPRSGTTLIEQILASHPAVGGAGEASYLEDCVRLADRLTGKPFPACLRSLTGDQAAHIGGFYLERLKRGFSGKTHVVDKTPMNFQYVSLIKRILPRARVIHCQREALETCLSIYRLPFDSSQAYAHDLAALGSFYRHYAALMARTEAELDDIVHPVQLDELIDHSEQIVPKLCSFVGLGFDEAMLRFHEAERVVRTPSAMQVREPLRRAPMKWGDRFGEAAAPLIEALASPG